MTHDLRERWQFFLANAGYCTPPGRAACALSLSRAEVWREENDVQVEWVWDESGCSGCDCKSLSCPCSSGADHETLGCIVTLDGESESLWGICGAEAELCDQLEDRPTGWLAETVLSL